MLPRSPHQRSSSSPSFSPSSSNHPQPTTTYPHSNPAAASPSPSPPSTDPRDHFSDDDWYRGQLSPRADTPPRIRATPEFIANLPVIPLRIQRAMSKNEETGDMPPETCQICQKAIVKREVDDDDRRYKMKEVATLPWCGHWFHGG
ncbi:hypothetical protein QBC41DRAFT_298648 [Cercophora samala]|uniref:Uncharacterized protein n=1 Tax=Cercophora samala TaxID=330535 RepID=A0AA39ZLS4_9PEZI|nr:hypothetical protein QBC41DRAFT_298648 [Cercophora samala]